MTDASEIGRLGVTHRDDEARTGEDVHLAELDLLGRIHVTRGRSTMNIGVSVAIELRPLMSVQRVFDGERVQAELVRDLAQLRLVGTVQPDPGHAVTLAHLLEGLVER